MTQYNASGIFRTIKPSISGRECSTTKPLCSLKILHHFPKVLKWGKTLNTDDEKKVSKGAKIRNRYDQVPHLTQDTN